MLTEGANQPSTLKQTKHRLSQPDRYRFSIPARDVANQCYNQKPSIRKMTIIAAHGTRCLRSRICNCEISRGVTPMVTGRVQRGLAGIWNCESKLCGSIVSKE